MKAAKFRLESTPSITDGKRRPSTINTGYRPGCSLLPSLEKINRSNKLLIVVNNNFKTLKVRK